MIIYKSIKDIQNQIQKLKAKKQTVGFVPTMGALHQGHISLLQNAKSKADVVVCSIYVNPSQFNDKTDLEKYPRTLASDIEKLTKEKVDILFLPDDHSMYPEGINTLTQFNLGKLETVLEGAKRPGHFQGVCNVVNHLLKIIEPDFLFLGQKDFQQVKVIEALLKEMRQENIQLIVCPIMREEDGLAMSSRNVRLTAENRKNANLIFDSLKWMKENFGKNSLQELKASTLNKLAAIPNAEIDYLEICNMDDFEIATEKQAGKELIALTVVSIGGVRLLDNMIL